MLRIMHKLGGTDGAEIAEAALVLPIVFMFLLGIIWFGRAFNIYSTITQAAKQGAVTAARPSCATCPVGADVWGGTTFPGNTTVANSVCSVMKASSVDASQIIVSPAVTYQSCPAAPPYSCTITTDICTGGGGANITICRSVLLTPSGSPPSQPAQCGAIVSFKYPFQMNLPFTSLNMQQIVLTAQAQSRMEN